ncbi:hypothetical protein CLOP_g20173 [Closterium sp. NIES-67]|nr:hypothetical protein CLOP_g20173 [Closterium sp. NIES-67]
MSGVSRSGGMSKVRDVPRISDVSSGQKSRLAAALKVLLIGDSAVGRAVCCFASQRTTSDTISHPRSGLTS